MTTATEEERKEEERKEKERTDAVGEEKNEDDPMKTIMASLGGIGDALTSLGKRMDAIEKQEVRADSLAARLDAVNAANAPRNDADEAALASEQFKADSLEQAWGKSAPRYMPGESLRAYRVRTLHAHKQHSQYWKDIDLSKLPIEAVSVAAEQIRADSLAASLNPAAPPDQLISRTRQTGTGHVMTEYFGSVHAADAPFRIPPRLATIRPIDGLGRII